MTLLFLTGLFEDLPEATLAAVVIAAVIELVDVGALVALFRTSTTGLGRIYGVAARPDFIAAVAAMLGVLIFDTLPGLVIGVLVSVLLLLYRTSRPNVAVLGELQGTSSFADITRNGEAHEIPGVLIVRPESSLLFVDADHVRGSIMKAITADTRAVILDAETVPSIDITAASSLTELASDLGERGIRFLLARRRRPAPGPLAGRRGNSVASRPEAVPNGARGLGSGARGERVTSQEPPRFV